MRTEADFDAAIASRLADLEGIQTELLDIRYQRNAVIPPISRLPNEIIMVIIFHLANDCHGDYNPCSWIVATHVCRRWRDLALSHSRLWASKIPLSNNIDCLKEFLRRSGTAPLTVRPRKEYCDWREDIDGEQDPLVYRRLELEAYRIRDLSLDISDRLVRRLVRTPAIEAPLLRKLRVVYLEDPNPDTRPILWFLTKAVLPELKTVELRCLPMSLCLALVRPTLTRLYIATIPSAPVSDWVKLLAQTPSLEILVIHESIRLDDDFTSTDELSTSSTTIPLSHLRRLILTWDDHGIACGWFFDHLALPEECSVQLIASGLAPPHPYVTSVFASKLSATWTSVYTQPHACSLTYRADYIAISIWKKRSDMGYKGGFVSTLRNPLDDREDPEPSMQFEIRCGSDDDLRETTLPDLLERLPLADVRVLYMDGQPDSGLEAFRAIFAAFHCVDEVRYTSRHPHLFLHFLTASTWPTPVDEMPSPTQPALPIFPKLRALTLRGARWTRAGLTERLRDLHLTTEPLPQSIEAVLAVRSRSTLDEFRFVDVRGVYETELPWLDNMAARYAGFMYDANVIILE